MRKKLAQKRQAQRIMTRERERERERERHDKHIPSVISIFPGILIKILQRA